jgi:glucose/arabinose dehydrogenase
MRPPSTVYNSNCMNRLISALVLLMCLHGSTFGADFECRWAEAPPKIDGKLDDAAWKDAQVIEEFTSAWLPEGQRKPPTATKARLLWDREYLYFSAEMEDWDVFANVTEQDGAIWTCDVFELFFKPAKDKPGYYELEVNAANGKLDMFLPSRGAGHYNRFAKERDFHIESAIEVRGTINNWSDRDKGWTVEARMPWRDFLPTGGRPAPGDVWMHSLCRYDYSIGLEKHSLSTNTPKASEGKADFHRYEDYVPLKFIGPKEGAALKRVPWDTSRLVGSPEPPLPFKSVNVFPNLKTTFPITVLPELNRDSFLLLENNGYGPVRKSRLLRISNDPAITTPEVLLEFDESIYDACFHPRFSENGYLFIGANGRFGEGRMEFNNRLLRYSMDRTTGRIDPGSRTLFLEFQSHGHNGMALAFGKDGMLYVTSGDGTSDCDEWSSGQDLTRLLAKLLRIDVDRPSGDKPYSIPSDNPFLTFADARPETWAYGFRNPWRLTMDRVTGEFWVGENGQDLWEYARIARRGENYGWPLLEGSHELHQHRKAGPTPFTKPLIEHSHTDFRSLTGGIVYRGAKFPSLVGCYIYGDYGTGQIWAAREKDGKLVDNQCIADTPLGITCFCETPAGDILVVDYLGNAIYKLERHIEATTASRPPFPEKLSDAGLFSDVASLKPHPALIAYEINAPAWHDGATSQRYIALPGQERMEFTERNGWNFPDGTALVQTLSGEGKRIETRVLLRLQNEWAGYSYAWNESQTDATLMPKEGVTRNHWRFPARQECTLCHARAVNYVLGLSTVQLNRSGQLARWEREGLLKFDHSKTEESQWRGEFEKQGLTDTAVQAKLDLVMRTELQREPAKDSPLLPRPANKLPRIVDPRNEKAPVRDRARAYLHANCSHCHVRSGGGNSKMQLASHIDDAGMQILNADPMHATYGIPEVKLATPGAPERSLLVYRPAVRGPGQMPPVGTLKPDGEGIALLAKWLAEMKPAPAAR